MPSDCVSYVNKTSHLTDPIRCQRVTVKVKGDGIRAHWFIGKVMEACQIWMLQSLLHLPEQITSGLQMSDHMLIVYRIGNRDHVQVCNRV